jgi:hypothetical protein
MSDVRISPGRTAYGRWGSQEIGRQMHRAAANTMCLAAAGQTRSAVAGRYAPASSAPHIRITPLISLLLSTSQAPSEASITLAAPDRSLRSLTMAIKRMPRSAAGIALPSERGRTSAARPIRRSSARRRAQRQLMMGVLAQNGARHEQWCAAVLASAGASYGGTRQRAEV